jgi:hypothetical protein
LIFLSLLFLSILKQKLIIYDDTDNQNLQAAVTYGDPLKNYGFGPGTWGSLPKERTLIFCNSGDGVCGGAFSISAAHLSYTSNGDIKKGVDFVAKTLSALGEGPLQAAAAPAPSMGGFGGAGGAPGGAKGAGMPKGKGKGGGGFPKMAEVPKASAPEVPAESGESRFSFDFTEV